MGGTYIDGRGVTVRPCTPPYPHPPHPAVVCAGYIVRCAALHINDLAMLCAVRVRLCHLYMALCAGRVLAGCVCTHARGRRVERVPFSLLCLCCCWSNLLRLLSSLWCCVACLPVGYLLSGG